MNVLPFRRAAMHLGLACGSLLLLTAGAPGAHAEEVNKSYTVSGRARVHVETNDGSVTVTTSNSKQVEFRVEYLGYELNKDLHVDSRQNGDTVELTAKLTGHWGFTWGHSNRRLHLEIRMPRDADLVANTGDGAVQVDSLNGNIAVHTGDGSVKASGLAGQIDLHTNDGSISVDNLKGDIKLRTGDGSIEARDLDGKVDADSGDGRIRLVGRFDLLNVKTGDGSVETKVLPGSRMASSWTLRTGDGSVDLSLPSDFQSDIDASTGDGHISVGFQLSVEGNFSNSQIRGKMNGGGQPLTVHTGDGSIRLSKS